MDKSTLTRFRGIAALYGMRGLERLLQSKAAVIGVGGVGSWASEALARSGVGTIMLLDCDTVCLSNFNRQCPAISENMDMLKVEAMARRLLSINPALNIEIQSMRLTEENLDDLFPLNISDDWAVIEAIDDQKAKTALIARLLQSKRTFVTAGGAGGKSDPSKAKIADLSDVTHDKLLSSTRQILRKAGIIPPAPKKTGITCAFLECESVDPRKINTDEELSQLAPTFDGGRVTFGTEMASTATVGLCLASALIGKILHG